MHWLPRASPRLGCVTQHPRADPDHTCHEKCSPCGHRSLRYTSRKSPQALFCDRQRHLSASYNGQGSCQFGPSPLRYVKGITCLKGGRGLIQRLRGANRSRALQYRWTCTSKGLSPGRNCTKWSYLHNAKRGPITILLSINAVLGTVFPKSSGTIDIVTACFRLLRGGKWQTIVHSFCDRVGRKKPDGARQTLEIPEAGSRPVMGRVAVSRLDHPYIHRATA